MRSRRILHCVPSMGGGGAERQLAYLGGQLCRLDWDVHVALVSEGPNFRRIETAGPTIHKIRARSNYDPGLFWRLCRTIQQVRPALVQVWMLQMEFAGALASRYQRVPWILSERSSVAAYPPSLKHRLRQWIALSASAVVANSAGGIEYWRGCLDPSIPRYIVRNALPLDEIDAVQPADPSELDLPSSHSLVLFAGRLTKEKNPETLMTALLRVVERPDTVVVVAGEGPLRPTLEAFVRRHGLGTRVRFPGYLTNVWAWMKRASVFVSPAWFEGHPNAVIEAAACRCPLVVSDIAAHREFLDEQSARLVSPNSSELLAAAILATLEEPADAGKRAACAAAIVGKWSQAQVARQYDGIYREVLDRALRRSEPCAAS